jgi:hypothetical protein
VSNDPKCPLNNGMSIVQKLVVKRRFHNRWKLHIVGTLPKSNTKIVETKVK